MRPQLPDWIVAIGASGSQGLDDIKALLAELEESCPAAVLVVLHRPTDKISYLRDILARAAAMPVVVARDGEALRPGVCYVGEPDAHLTLAASNLTHLVGDSGVEYRNRTIDLLFNSLARAMAPCVIGVVLSGSLDDGSRGLRAISKAGGLAMVMTPDRQGGGQMPANAIDYDGHIDFVGGGREIAGEIARVIAAHG